MSWTGMSPNELIHPMGCRECGIPGPHGWQWVDHKGLHQWVMPTQRQIKYRMIRRRKYHAATRWVTR